MTLPCYCNFNSSSTISSSGSESSSSSTSSASSNSTHRKHNRILEFLGKLYSRRPFIILLVTLSIAILLTWLAISQFGFPEFDDPYLGFETRFTPIANRLISLENLRREVHRLERLENYPGEKLTGREWRRKRQSGDNSFESDSNGNLCTNYPLEGYSRIALELDSAANVLSAEVLSLVCFFQKLIEEISSYNEICEKDDDRMCCPMWSLPNYVVRFANKTDCANINAQDISNFNRSLSLCQEVYKNETTYEECQIRGEKCPPICRRGGVLHTALYNTIDKYYSSTNKTRFTMIVLPIPKTTGVIRPLAEHLQNSIAKLQLPKNTVFLAGFDFGGKDWLFKRYLIWDLQYVMIGSIVIFLIVCFYTKSFFVTVISFGVLTLSVGIAYFFYTAVYSIPYFPFMNMLVTIIVMGIGTDATLIFSVVWQRLKVENPVITKSLREEMMISTLEETSATLLITTCTTAGAFFASLTSSITTIRCFSIFAGTAIIIGFILLYICVPTALVLSDLIWSYICSLMPQSTENEGKFHSKFLLIYDRLESFKFVLSTTIPNTARFVLDKLTRTKLWIVCFILFNSVLVWASIVVFYSPQFQLPNSEQFQLLSTSHPAEKYDREVEPSFSEVYWTGESVENPDAEKITLYFIWGIESTDTGYGLDPNDNGKLVFNKDFSISNPTNQKWIRKLCNKLKKQSFYDEVANSVVGAHYDSCFIDTMIKWMKRDCEHAFIKNGTYFPCCKLSKFPYDKDIFSRCVGLAARDVYRTPALYFQPDIAGPKFFVLNEENVTESSGQLATFTLRVKTNVSYSLSYGKMSKFYSDVDNFFQGEMSGNGSNVPKGLNDGFFVSAHLDFFDLQTSLLNDTWQSVLLSAGLCFFFLWISSCSCFIAFGAVLSIFAIVMVSSAVLIQGFNWKLGVFESIAVTVAIGLSDFTAHHALEFSKRKSVIEMTSPTFFSALTTVTMGLFMLSFSNVLVYQQIGSFFFVLVIVSWLYSVFFLSPVLIMLEYIVNIFNKLLRHICHSKCCTGHPEGQSSYIERENMGSNTEIPDGLQSPNLPEKKQSIMMEKWKLLKRFTQETTV